MGNLHLTQLTQFWASGMSQPSGAKKPTFYRPLTARLEQAAEKL